ncbi:MAG: hypothetical protein KF773_06190 [Deltaproteobacteria bacterium]|nr:hypothetical protein [Deltaproteobacteria bacterium]
MRALLALCLVGCVIRPPQDPTEPPPTGPPGDCNRTCFAGEVCARDHLCHPADDVRSIRAEWTVRGQTANSASCAGAPNLYIRFEASDDTVGYSPVPCRLGLFTMDKLPTTFTQVELGINDPDGRYGGVTHAVDAEGHVAFDLTP